MEGVLGLFRGACELSAELEQEASATTEDSPWCQCEHEPDIKVVRGEDDPLPEDEICDRCGKPIDRTVVKIVWEDASPLAGDPEGLDCE